MFDDDYDPMFHEEEEQQQPADISDDMAPYIGSSVVREDIRQAVDELVKDPSRWEQSQDLIVPSFGVQELFDDNLHRFNAPALEALRKKSTALVNENAEARFFGKLVPQTKLQDGIAFICDKLNTLADKGYIDSALQPLFQMPISTKDENGINKCAVLSYVLIKREGLNFVDNNVKDALTEEGGNIPEL